MEKTLEKWRSLDDNNRLVTAYRYIMDLISEDASQDDQYLNTDFSKWAYFRQKYKIRSKAGQAIYRLRSELQAFREDTENYQNKDDLLYFVDDFVPRIVHWIEGKNGSHSSLVIPENWFPSIETKSQSAIRAARLLITGKDDDVFYVESNDNIPFSTVRLADEKVLEGESILKFLGGLLSFPFYIHAFDIDYTDETPLVESFVLVPDYLIDVTSIASGFVGKEFVPWVYLGQKLLPRTTTYYMMLGNIVNNMLDELIGNVDLDLEYFFEKIFQTNTVIIGKMDDDEVRKLMSAVRLHYGHLKIALNEGFQKIGIQREGCGLEPSFLSNQYGIQGRLDVLFQGDQVSIIELKSGKPFRPNSYGIKTDHYVQTLLYDLLLKSARISYSSRNFILYSSQSNRQLRYAPPVKAIQKRALAARNEIFIMDTMMRQKDLRFINALIRRYTQVSLGEISRFVARDADIVKNTISKSSDVEWKYYTHFLSFVQREITVSKLGRAGVSHRPGHAGLWLNSKDQKESDYSILFQLEYKGLIKEDDEFLINLSFGEDTNPLANFRKGDVIVMYPNSKGEQDILYHQVIKGSLVFVDENGIRVRPRSTQFDERLFNKYNSWNVERDVLDSSFKSMFDSLFLFISQPKIEKEKWLGLVSSGNGEEVEINHSYSEDMLPSQKDIVKRAFCSKDYYLIWGPPGTGKTSVVLRELIKIYFEKTEMDVFLLAYTNRAVDEICDVVENLDEEYMESTVRLGSRYSVAPIHQDLLFKRQIKGIKKRKELKEYLSKKRIFISTLASFWSQRSLVKSRKNSVLLVDEASQILEPAIVGLLGMFSKVILIGDHLQLPAVSVQGDTLGLIKEGNLTELGIDNCKTSLFQRLYKRCHDQNWEHSMGMLFQQGRMHQGIMAFVNHHFYEDRLEVIPTLTRLSSYLGEGDYEKRMSFISSDAFPMQRMLKNNIDEAEKVVRYIENWLLHRSITLKQINTSKIGIITPFRSQIALIKNELTKRWGRDSEVLTVDTVERYQGSARDVIIISTSVNRRSQMDAITSITDKGIDRKLNVAITRAKEQVVIIGNREILSTSNTYNAFIVAAGEIIL